MTPRDLLMHSDTGEPWPVHVGAGFTDMAMAYQTAQAVRALRIARGETPRGYKIGFTNRTIWPRYNVYAPIWGSMWNTTVAFSDNNDDDSAATVSLDHLCQPRLEPEAVFGFKACPPAGAGLDELFDALDWVAPGFELVQCHLPGWKFVAPQTVADGALHGRLQVGRRVPIRDLARDAGQLQHLLAGAHVRLHCNGEFIEEGVGAHVLDNPLRALMHFLNELRSCPGASDLTPGDIVTTGTWTDAWPVRAGETWSARFDTALPALAVRFV